MKKFGIMTRLAVAGLTILFLTACPNRATQTVDTSAEDPRVQAIWEKFEAQVAAYADTVDTDAMEQAETFQTTMTSSMEVEGVPSETVIVSAVDIPNRRIVAETETSGEYESSFKVLYNDGEIYFSSVFDGELETYKLDGPEKAEMVAIYNQMFTWLDTMSDPEAVAALTEENMDAGRYDGYQVYGDVLEGEQITLDLSNNPILEGSPMPEFGLTSMVFTPEGLIAGQVTEIEGEQFLMVYDQPTAFVSGFTDMSYTMYQFDGEEITWAGDFQLSLTLNPALGESLFEPPTVTDSID